MAELKIIEKNIVEQYCDGEQIEKEILDYVRNTPSGDYSEVLAQDQRWPVFYHLTDMREGILNWYDFTPGCDVLEIGAGMGALTGLLCRTCGTVTSVELTLPCARVIEERCKQYDNLTIMVGNFNRMEFPRQYDYITLIGVLEYAPGFTESGDPADFLRRIRSLLKPDGKLLLAIENRFGLKYWCGANEDNTGKPYSGINGYLEDPQVRTWSRSELSELLSGCGFDKQKFFYPLPDYKLPQVLYSDAYLPKEKLKKKIRTYYLDSPKLLSDEKQIFTDVIENNAFPFMANSFFVECGSEEIKDNQPIYAAFTYERYPQEQIITKIYANEAVQKKAACPEAKEHLNEIFENQIKFKESSLIPYVWEGEHLRMPYIHAPTLEDLLLEALGNKEIGRAKKWIDRLYQQILESSETVAENDKPVLRYGFLEMNFQNCFVQDDKLLFYDQEWIEEKIPARYILYRAIKNFYVENADLADIVPPERLVRFKKSEKKEFEQIDRAFLHRVLRQSFNPVFRLDQYRGEVDRDLILRGRKIDDTVYTCSCYFDTGNGYSDKGSKTIGILPGQEISVKIDVPKGAVAMRLDPINERFCVIRVIKAESDKGVLTVVNNTGFQDEDYYYFFTANPQLEIPMQEGTEWIQICFELYIYKNEENSDAIIRYLTEIHDKMQKLNEKEQEVITLQASLDTVKEEKREKEQEIITLQTSLNTTEEQLRILHDDYAVMEEKKWEKESEVIALQTSLSMAEEKIHGFQNALSEVCESTSWRVTKPARELVGFLKKLIKK